MRTPRPEDFDPKARIPEEVDLSGVVPLKAAKTADEEKTERFSERKSERTEKRTVFRTGDLPLKRPTKRYSFEFYEDQISKLKQLKVEAEMSGENLSLSEMARQAFDDYLEDK